MRRPEPGKALDPFHLATLALLPVAALWLALPLAWLFAQAPRGYSEGWNALVALRAVGDLPLYPQDQTLHTNNYPPLWFYVVGGLGALLGDNVVAGRLVSLAATLAVAAEIALAVRLLGGAWWVAAFAGLLFIPGAMGLDHRTVGGNEPHMLAHLAAIEGRVMCETLALCYWAGKGLEVDSCNARQGFLARGRDERVLLDLLANGELAAVQLTDAEPTRDDERISAAFMDSLRRHYRLARVSENGAFFVYATGARPPD